MKISNKNIIITTLMLMAFLCSAPAFAEETMEDLKRQVELLQKRVEELESSKEQKKEEDSSGFLNQRRNMGWDPFSEMERMQEEMDRMFQHSFSRRGLGGTGMFSSNMSFDAELDLKETKEGYEIIFDMKGLDEEKIDIQINEHSITVKGEHNSQETEENPNQYFSSRSFGSFMKTIPLPVDADTSKVKTEKKGDKLVIKLPKKTS